MAVSLKMSKRLVIVLSVVNGLLLAVCLFFGLMVKRGHFPWLLADSATTTVVESSALSGGERKDVGALAGANDNSSNGKQLVELTKSKDKSVVGAQSATNKSVAQTQAPVIKASAPAVKAQTPVAKIPASVIKASASEVKVQTPVVKTAAPVNKTSVPVVKTPEPIAQIENGQNSRISLSLIHI